MPAWIFSDAANVFRQNGVQYSVNGTYWGYSGLVDARQRRLDGMHMVSLAGPGGEWQGEHTPTAKVLGLLQKGCYCRINTGGVKENVSDLRA